MGSYRNAVITNQGLDYIAQALAGEIMLTFSHMAISDYAYPEGTNLAALTSLQSVKMTVVPASVWVQDTTVGVRGMFSNTTVATEYPINTVGVYATNGTTEILFSVSTATSPDIMEAYNGVAPSSFIYTVQETINEASSLNITISEAGMATAQDIADLQEQKQDNITGAASTITEDNLAASRALASDASGKVVASPVTATELGYLDGVTSNVQTQLNNKQASITGGASTIATNNLTANRALMSNSTGKVVVSDVTSTELGYLDGVTSNIQTQFDGKVGFLTGTRFATLAEFVAATDADNNHKSWMGYFQDTSGWGPNATANSWYRCIVSYQNAYGGTTSVAGNIQVFGPNLVDCWIGYITGYNASNITATWRRIMTSAGADRLPENRAIYVNAYNSIAASAVTSTELGYLSGVTSPLQTQLGNLTPELANYNTFLVEDKNISSGVWTNAGSFTLTRGVWVVQLTISWDANSNGSRGAHLSDTATGERITYSASVFGQASTGDRTIQQITYLYSGSSNRTLNLVVRQASGSTVKVSTRLNTLKIAYI